MAAGLAGMAAAFAATDADGRLADARAGDAVDRLRRLRHDALALADADAAVYGSVLQASSPDERRDALRHATDVPLQVAELAREVAVLAAASVHGGRPALRGDAQVAAILAAAAARSAAHLVRCNVEAGDLDPGLCDRADALADAASSVAGPPDRA